MDGRIEMKDKMTAAELEAAVAAAAEAGDFRRAQKLQRQLDRARSNAQAEPAAQNPGASTRSTAAAADTRAEQSRRAASGAANRRLTTIAGVSIAVAIGATALGGFTLVRSRAAIEHVEGNSVEAVVAARDIDPGTVLTEADLKVATVPGDFAPSDLAKGLDELLGKKTITTQTAGMAVPLSSIATSSAPAGLPAAIGDGMLGVMVSLATDAAASPLLSVGDRVDVLGTVSDGAATSTQVLAQDVRVIALDGRLTGDGEDGYTLVTLELDPESANRVTAAGDIHLAVRPMVQEVTEDAE